MSVLALGGSVRAHSNHAATLLEIVQKSQTLEEYISSLYENKSITSNTEILSGAALLGAKSQGAKIDYYPLSQCFLNSNPLEQNDLKSKIREAEALCIASPVYFGDRSSLVHQFLEFCRNQDLLLDKPVSSLSVGAKRNGGQETTNIFLLAECSELGSWVTGNGPPLSQYGGIGHAGDPRTVLEDRLGMKTAYSTGTQLGRLARLFKKFPENASDNRVQIAVLSTMDTSDGLLRNHLDKLISSGKEGRATFEILDLTDNEIYQCLACSICPIPELLQTRDAYACIIQDREDSMQSIRSILRKADGIVIAGLDLKNTQKVTDHYQLFTERTRFIRRNDFELSYKPITSFVIQEVGARSNPYFSMKVLSSYLRHNSILLPPIRQVNHEGKVLISGIREWQRFLDQVIKITQFRKANAPFRVSYKAGGTGGYSDTRLDDTSALR